MRILLTLVLTVFGSGRVFAQDDEAALALADQTSTTEQHARSWNAMAEAAVTRSDSRWSDEALYGERLSIDFRFDGRLAQNVRAVVSDRLDMRRESGVSDGADVNTLKEAYLSWQPRADRILDFGRINVRTGTASGYNPTDYLRADAVRSVVSINPGSLRENRLGSVMMRGQMLWTGGSLSALFSPKLADEPSDGIFSPDWGASNRTNRWLISLSPPFARDLSPQLLLFGSEGRSPQVGLNLTHLLNSATVAYVEWSGGRSEPQVSQLMTSPGRKAFRSQFSTGLTYTAPFRLSVTLEYEQNDAAPGQEQWDSLRQGSVAEFGRYLRFAGDQQELATRRAVFTYASWQDAFTSNLDLTGFTRMSLEDHSRLSWMEARYHWEQFDAAVQWQASSGASRTVYGSSSQGRLWQLLFARYFP